MKKIILLNIAFVLILLKNNGVEAQNYERLNPKWNSLVMPQSTNRWIDFRESISIQPNRIFMDYKDAFELSNDDQMVLMRTEKDELGFTHFRYQQYYKNIKVIFGEYIIHQLSDGFLKSANGRLITKLNLSNQPSVNESEALASALLFMNAKKYAWENPDLENDYKHHKNDPSATYFPKGELVYAPGDENSSFQASEYKLSWKFNIHTDDQAVVSKIIYVNAINNKVIRNTSIELSCSTGSGTTTFNGTQNFETYWNGSTYKSMSACKLGVYGFSTIGYLQVFNANGGSPGGFLSSGTNYTDANNNWNNTSQLSAAQCMFGVQSTYDYYFDHHGRNSWNNTGGAMVAINNANAGQNNAVWNGVCATFYAGNTSSASDDWNTLDIVGHEFTHGVTQSSASLDYSKESGALNESFSDIFGEMIESYTLGNCDYLIGADRSSGGIRNFINPNYKNDPDTYLGTHWYNTIGCSPEGDQNDPDYNDNCGVHTNSSVQNHWFYLLSEGGSGTNDHGTHYNVTGITRYAARDIAYRALTNYLTSSDGYIDARQASIHAAIDLFGSCSNEAIQVGNAWRAVGVEFQSSMYATVACGNFPSGGTNIKAISELDAASGCTATILASSTHVYFSATDRVKLFPGFRALSGSNFHAYTTPCNITVYKTNTGPHRSDAEKGLMHGEASQELSILDKLNGISIAPNPFNSTFEISLNLKADENAKCTIYNASGIKVKDLFQGNLAKGSIKLPFNCNDISPGVYMLEINLGDTKTVKRIVKI